MKKTIAALALIITAIACEFAPKENNSDSTTVPVVVVDTTVSPVVIDTLVTPEGDTLISPIQK